MSTSCTEPIQPRLRWRNPRIYLVCLGLVGLIYLAFRVVDNRSFDVELQRASREVELGEFGSARDRLARLAIKRPGRADVQYPLGVAERALNHPDSALNAWASLPPDAPQAPQAALMRAKILIQKFGRLAEAEASLETARRGPAKTANTATWTLAEILLWEGRINEVRRLLESAWSQTPGADRIALLREHWRLDHVVIADGDVRPMLDLATLHAPDDYRVSLVRAALAISSSQFEEAASRLKTCREANPDDPAVWQVSLRWAIAAGRTDEAALAIRHLPQDWLTPREVLSLRIWFAARRADTVAERRLLEVLIEWGKGESVALERLAVLAHQEGNFTAETEMRRRKAEVDQAKERYRWLLIRLPAQPDSSTLLDLARQAEDLGRDFEAQGWLTLALGRTSDDSAVRDSLSRLTHREQTLVVPKDALSAALLADLAQSIPKASSSKVLVKIPSFTDEVKAAGLETSYISPNSPLHQIPEVLGGGVALFDYDGDGWLDVFLTQGGSSFPAQSQASRRPGEGERLYRNKGNGTFEDVSVKSGITALSHGFGQGVTVGDYDNDGHPDLFLTRWGEYALYRSTGHGTFEDVTEKTGLGGDRGFPTSAAFADFDNDGDLDLFVCHYLQWDAVNPPTCRSSRFPDRNVSCLPRQFPAEPDRLFRNDGGRFVDVTESAGIIDKDGRGLGVVAADIDGDGRVDIYVANDQSANALYRNLGGLRFEEVGFTLGVACGADGSYRAGMGVACSDLDRDGLPDLAVTNFFGESTSFYKNLGGTFSDQTAAFGLEGPSRSLLGFGIAFLDANNDGRLDLATANGHVNDERPTSPFAMHAQLLLGDERGKLTDASEQAGLPWNRLIVGRGLAVGDLNNDGRVDVVIVAQNGPLILAKNTTDGGHSVTFRLEGTTSNRDAVGARVTVKTGDQRQTVWRVGGGSYESASDPRLHFGVGSAQRLDEVEIAWPSGHTDKFRNIDVNKGYLIREHATKPKPLNGFPQERHPLRP